jgi:uncharacterized protein
MSNIKLTEYPQKPTIIEGFPGFGLVGSITTEFLIEHLQMRPIGSIFNHKLPAMSAIHNGELVRPIGLFYDEKHNIIVVHIITNAQGLEWEIGDDILQIAHDLDAYRLITVEGVADPQEKEHEPQVMYWTNDKNQAPQGITPLKEGIVMGVTSALMLKCHDVHITSLFALTHSQLPDSKAAAQIIKVLDQQLNLDVDYHPLLEAAKQFESKIKGIMSQSTHALNEQQKKTISYVG